MSVPDRSDTPDVDPTSEVGSERLSPRLPVRLRSEDKWQLLMEQQNRNFIALLENLNKSQPSVTKEIRLPEFDPDRPDVDARAWLSTADMCIDDPQCHGTLLMMALSHALKKQASTWLATVAYPGMKWCDFKELFMSRYDPCETTAAFLINLNARKPDDKQCLASYASGLMSSLMSRWKDLTTEQIAIATVVSHVSLFEPRVQRLAFTTDITTRNQLHQELKAVSFLKRKGTHNDCDEPEPKKSHFSGQNTNIKCFFCGRLGHKSTQCLSKREANHNINRLKTDGSKKDTSLEKPITCFVCREPGHYATTCPKRSRQEESSSEATAKKKRVDLCVVEAPTGHLRHSGERLPFYYDSGAECSLVKETVACKFSGKRFYNVVTMTGIGQTCVNSTSQILTIVEIDDIFLEILFHVLPDSCLHHNVLIGREVLAQGLAIHMTSNKLHFAKLKVIETCPVLPTNEIDFDSIDTDVPAEKRDLLIDMLRPFRDSFTTGVPTTRADADPMQIRLKDPHRTVNRRPYRLSPEETQVVRRKVDELLTAGIVRPSSSPFASPILLVKKKDGSDRMCVDYRELNDNTIPDRFPLPLISDQIAKLHGGHFFTILDMASGFHQIPIESDSIERTAFVTPEGQYEYLAMPFGLRNAPSVFQRAIIKALGNLVNTYVVVYMDDVLIVADSVDQALERLEVVLKVLTEKRFSLNIRKCAFLKQKVEYLGFEVSQGEIRPNPRKIKALTALPPPETVRQLRQFIGLASYFRQFVPQFSQIMAPLYALTAQGTGKIKWQPDHETVRQQIIKSLTNEQVLMIFDPDLEVELHTDASAIGYGAVLMQRKQGKLHAIAYFSKRTTTAESKYHSYELETLAVVNAVKHFRHYLHGRKFLVVTDCSSLRATRKKLDLSPRVHRWWAFLQSFDFEIIHVNGKRMSHADFFSRNPLPDESTDSTDKAETRRIDVTEISDNWLLAEQQQDAELGKLRTDLQENRLPDHIAKTYELRSHILHRKIQRQGKTRSLPIIPRSLRWSIINNVHESLMHLGWQKTLEKVFDLYWFENMSKYVKRFVTNCVTCKVSKSHSGKVQVEMHPIAKTGIPWHTVHIDATGKLSGKNDKKEYVFVLIDAFSKYVLLHHAMHIDTASSVKALNASVSLFGAPTRIIADQGRCFASKEFKEYSDKNNIKLHLIATGSARANGQVERVMSTLKNMLTAAESTGRSWQDALPDIQLAINCTHNRVTKCSPLELLIGKVARPLSIMAADDTEREIDLEQVRGQALNNVEKSSAYDKTRFDSTKAKITPFSIGDFVLLQNEERNQTKLDPKYKGPFRIIDVLEGNRYTLKSLNSNRTYKYAHDRLRKMPDRQDDDIDSDDDEISATQTDSLPT